MGRGRTKSSGARYGRSQDWALAVATKQVQDDLQKIADTARNKVLTKAARKAITPLLRIARAAAPTVTGMLRQALAVKVKRYASGVVVAMAGTDANVLKRIDGKLRWPNKYMHLVEFGTAAHQQPRRKVLHPGAKAHPIIGQAAKQLGDRTAEIFAETMSDELAKLQTAAKGST